MCIILYRRRIVLVERERELDLDLDLDFELFFFCFLDSTQSPCCVIGRSKKQHRSRQFAHSKEDQLQMLTKCLCVLYLFLNVASCFLLPWHIGHLVRQDKTSKLNAVSGFSRSLIVDEVPDSTMCKPIREEYEERAHGIYIKK